MKPHCSHLFLEVGDIAKARWFWVEAIGLELLQDRGPYIQVGGNGGFAIGIEQTQSAVAPRDYPEITLRVEDVDAAAKRLASLGIEIIEGPADQPWGARHAWLLDPDGRRMSIYSSATPIMGL